MITGIDLSDKNGSLDWELLGNGDVNFVYIKATEAIDSIDSMYAVNMENARRLGIAAGAYHWLHPRLHVGQQADLFIRTVGEFRGLLPPVVCLETHYAEITEMEKNVRVFLDLVETGAGVKPIIYTSEHYWRTYLPEAKWGCEYPLWLDKPGAIWPAQLWPWAGWIFWQFSFQASLPGISTNLGLNWFNGLKTDLVKLVIQ